MSYHIIRYIILLGALTSGNVFAEKQKIEDIKDITINRHIKHVASKDLGSILPGAGYSHDSQQIPPNLCYNAVVTAKTGQQGIINLKSATSFSEFERQLHFYVDKKADFGIFSSEAEAEYFRAIQDLDYSLSLNYSEYLFNTVMLRLDGVGQKILTEKGKEIYNNEVIKKYFSILCGDDYISAYNQGALLLMGINVRFSSHLDKQEFNARVETSFGSLVNASTQIQSMAKLYGINGVVIIMAYQQGGDPTELSKILAKDEKGTYYALSCDLQHMDNCVKAASGLLNYAVEDFPKQISFETEKGVVPLGMSFIKHDPISEYGLTPPSTLVTKEVIEDREFLENSLKENQYYQQKLDLLLHGYVPWTLFGKESETYKTIKSLYKNTIENIDLIMLPSNPDDGGLKCYSHPTLCHELTGSIKNQIKDISSHLDFLKELKIAFTLDPYNGNYWYPMPMDWVIFINKDNRWGWSWGDLTITDQAIKDIRLTTVCPWIAPWPSPLQCPTDFTFKGLLTGELPKKGNNYTGESIWDQSGWAVRKNITIQPIPNPFYFDKYQPELDKQK